MAQELRFQAGLNLYISLVAQLLFGFVLSCRLLDI